MVDRSDLTDEELLRLPPDQDAFRELIERYDPSLRGMLRKLGVGDDAVDDLVQDAWMRLYSSWAEGRFIYQPERGPLSGYLFMMAKNLWADRLDKARSRARSAIPLDDRQLDHVPTTEGEPVVEELVSAEVQRLLDEALTRLNDEERAIVESRLAGVTYQEIAEQLGKSLNWVWKSFQRTVEKLRQELDQATSEGVEEEAPRQEL